MSKDFEIRPAKPDEADALSQIAMASKASLGYSQAFMQACEAELTYSPSQVESADYDFWVAEAESVILGFGVTKVVSRHKRELEALFVHPDRKKSGVGRTLMRQLIYRAQRKGCTTLEIQSDPHAVPFYSKLGAKQIGVRLSGSIPGRMLPLLELDLNSIGHHPT